MNVEKIIAGILRASFARSSITKDHIQERILCSESVDWPPRIYEGSRGPSGDQGGEDGLDQEGRELDILALARTGIGKVTSVVQTPLDPLAKNEEINYLFPFPSSLPLIFSKTRKHGPKHAFADTLLFNSNICFPSFLSFQNELLSNP